MLMKYLSLLFVAAICAGPASAEAAIAAGDGPRLIDLARLSITSVCASSVNGDRPLDNVFYGVQNMFDGGANVVNNINYSYWLPSRIVAPWVKISFDVPVTVHGLVIEFADRHLRKPRGAEQKEYAVELVTGGESDRTVHYYDSRPATGFVCTQTLPTPLKNVSEAKITFSGFPDLAVAEIHVIGTPPEGVNTTPTKPRVEDGLQHHVISMDYRYNGETEGKILSIAETAAPVGGNAAEKWWYEEKEGFKLPYALTKEALDYYVEQINSYRRRNWEEVTNPSSRLIYDALVTAKPQYKDRDLVLSNVYVVEMNVNFTGYTATEHFVQFFKWRKVILDQQGKVLAVFGDEKTPTSLNIRVGT